ncbi:hypothetical protein AAG906_037916 [Vitis piasezkii]
MVDQPTFKPKHDEGLLEPSEKLANLSSWTRRKEMQPLLNEVEIQRHAKEEPPKLILNPLPPEMKYAYRLTIWHKRPLLPRAYCRLEKKNPHQSTPRGNQGEPKQSTSPPDLTWSDQFLRSRAIDASWSTKVSRTSGLERHLVELRQFSSLRRYLEIFKHRSVIIKRPMVTAPPIHGNLDCRAKPFHSKLYLR